MGNYTADNGMHHVLIVDDEDMVLVSLRDTLAREGYQVTTAPNAVEGLARMKEKGLTFVVRAKMRPSIL